MSVQKYSCQNSYNHKEHDFVLNTPLSSYNPIHYFFQNKSSPYVFNRFNATQNREDRQKYFNEYNAYLFLKNDVHPYEPTASKQLFDQTFIYFNKKEIPVNFVEKRKTTDDSEINYYCDKKNIEMVNIQREKYVMKIPANTNWNSRCRCQKVFKRIEFQQQPGEIKFPKCEICRKKWAEEIQSHYTLVA